MDENLIIKEADKGSGVVLMHRKFYAQKMHEMLNDERTYKKLRKNWQENVTMKK